MQRYNNNAALVDHLTYSYPGSSSRLSGVTDAVSGNPEPWDARTGSFTYDANGNLKTAPAPYALSSVTYDYQNLPLSLIRSGLTTIYRYNEAGQRIAKQVNGGNTEVYLLDGAMALGVVTVSGSGSAVSWYWDLVAGDKVVGRQPSSGNRRYYHTDLLGSTRAVVDGSTQAVVESYDYDPWGVLLPGRTLAGSTKEGFTGKEQDAETGLHYFGARYDMSALGRWAAVDPLAEEHPEWSSYNYVFNNPAALIDPDGLDTLTGKAAQDFFRKLQRQSIRSGPGDKREVPTVALGAATAVALDPPTAPVGAVIVVGILAGAATIAVTEGAERLGEKAHVTYTRTNPVTGQVYVGRTSGYGDPNRLVRDRASSHPERLAGFGPPVVDAVAVGEGGRLAIRGREQQLIDSYGGVGSPQVANLIRGVARINPFGRLYHAASNVMFGELHSYTGWP